ncbi:MAG: hypothetical protein KDI69_07165 [Xanthomonadales bacterium]|nr:hypothetical protein [Xanthomonadales bacterium]
MLAGSIYPVVGEYDKALEQSRQAIELTPSSAVAYALYMDNTIALGRVADAQGVYEQARRLKLISPFFAIDLYLLAFLRHDAAEMERQLAQARGDPLAEHLILALAADAAAWQGRLQ